MKKLLIPILILPLMFFTGCSEEEETVVGSTDVEGCIDELADNYNADATVDDGSCEYPPSYTIDDMVGTWNMASNTVGGSVSADFSDLNESDCEGADVECSELGGTLTGTACTVDILEEECCEEGQSEVITIESNGTLTASWTDVDDDGTTESETDTGTISINGTNITVSFDEEWCECDELDESECELMDGCNYDDDNDECYGEYEGDCQDTISGTLSIDGNTATMSWEIDTDEFLEDYFGKDDDEDMCYDLSQSECEDSMYGCEWNETGCFAADDEMYCDLPEPTVSLSHTMVWEKATE